MPQRRGKEGGSPSPLEAHTTPMAWREGCICHVGQQLCQVDGPPAQTRQEKVKVTALSPSLLPPTTTCRFLDAMLVSRELKAGSTEFAKRVAEDDKKRLVRDRFALLKLCIEGADVQTIPYLYNLK